MISNRLIYQAFQNDLPKAQIYLTDGTYLSPKRDWVTGEFYNKLYLNWLVTNRVSRWKSYSDCDNFAITFYTFAQICHARTMSNLSYQGEPISEGLTVGVMFYMTGKDTSSAEKPGTGHAINVIFTERGNEYFEPQTGKYIKLTKDERESCWFVLC